MGTVFWITGFSGAGKTTIGKLLYEKIKEKSSNTVFFDGDTLRQVFDGDFGYTKEERHKCAMRYARLCALLAEQGMTVICCTISMFDSVREWNRKHIPDYFEVYVRVSMETLQSRDQKGLYSGTSAEKDIHIVGVHLDFEEPKNPDLILQNDGDIMPREQAEIIFNRKMGKAEETGECDGSGGKVKFRNGNADI